jgi:hypothetical protein
MGVVGATPVVEQFVSGNISSNVSNTTVIHTLALYDPILKTESFSVYGPTVYEKTWVQVNRSPLPEFNLIVSNHTNTTGLYNFLIFYRVKNIRGILSFNMTPTQYFRLLNEMVRI